MTGSEEIEAIKQLKARYFRLMDTKDWEGLAAVFTDDVLVDMTGEGGVVTQGAHEFVRVPREHIEEVTTVHHGHTPEVEITSATTANGVWAMEDRLWWSPGGPFRHLHGFGHYHETYEKTADGWRIKAMTLTRLHRIFD